MKTNPDLEKFYQTRAGRVSQQIITPRLKTHFQKEGRVLGIGYTAPYLESIPHEDISLSALDNHDFKPCSFESILLIHGLEFTQDRTALFRTVWELLADNGQLCLVVPNRVGFWARGGLAFSSGQIRRLLKDSLFEVHTLKPALFAPPLLVHTKLAGLYEKAGRCLFPILGGVWIVVAKKRLYAPSGTAKKKYRLLAEQIGVT